MSRSTSGATMEHLLCVRPHRKVSLGGSGRVSALRNVPSAFTGDGKGSAVGTETMEQVGPEMNYNARTVRLGDHNFRGMGWGRGG
jgi:hypothetical protein